MGEELRRFARENFLSVGRDVCKLLSDDPLSHQALIFAIENALRSISGTQAEANRRQ